MLFSSKNVVTWDYIDLRHVQTRCLVCFPKVLDEGVTTLAYIMFGSILKSCVIDWEISAEITETGLDMNPYVVNLVLSTEK